MLDAVSPDKAHLKQLPVKSFNVAPGDIVGGLIYVMDKPLGIEEGMVGISVQSPAYRVFIANKIKELIDAHKDPVKFTKTFDGMSKTLQMEINNAKKGSDERKELKTQLNALIRKHQSDIQLIKRFTPIFSDPKTNFYRISTEDQIDMLLNDKKHEKKRRPPEKKVLRNVGMGGLLLEAYQNELGIKPHEHFASKIGKLMQAGDKAYMVKQDGELHFGGTGPGFKKILNTTTGKRLRRLLNPLPLIATGGISALLFGVGVLGWRASYLYKNRRISANSDAIVESVATKMAKIRGFESQEIDTIEGTYPDKSSKIATIVTWSPGCRDLTGRLTGGEKEYNSVAVSVDKHGIPVKVNNQGHILRVKDVDENKKPLSYERVKADGSREVVSKHEYDNGKAVSDDTIAGLGESLITIISAGDRDALGKQGQNKAIRPIDPPINGKTHQFFGIDFGKAYKSQNPILRTLNDDFTFDNPKDNRKRFVNISMLYDNPLREKMKGIYLLAALRGKLDDDLKEDIAKDYEKTDPEFAKKLREYPQSALKEIAPDYEGTDPEVAKKLRGFAPNGKDSDLNLVKEQIRHYTDLAKAATNPVQKEEYFQYARRLAEIAYLAKESDEKILDKFKDRVKLLPSQIDVLENLEKLTSHKVNCTSVNGKVLLNHLRVEREDRVPWQLQNKGDEFILVCEETQNLNKIQNKLQLLAQFNNPALNAVLAKATVTDGKIQINVSKKELKTFQKAFTEEKVAHVRGVTEFRTSDQRAAFHDCLERNKTNKPMTILTQVRDLHPSIAPIADAALARERTQPLSFHQHNAPAQAKVEQPPIEATPSPSHTKIKTGPS